MLGALKAEILFSKAQKLVLQEKYNDALELFDKAIALNEKDSAVFIHKALAVSQLGRYNEAIKLAEKAISLKPQNAVYYAFLGMIHYDSENYEEAIKCFKKSNEIDSENAQTTCLENVARIAMGEVEEPVLVLREKIHLANSECKSRLLVLLERKISESLDDEKYNVITKKHFENEELTMNILFGIIYFEMKEYDKAESNLLASIETSPGVINYYYLGLCRIKKGDYKKAQYWFNKAMGCKSIFNTKERFDYLFDEFEKCTRGH
ncbi:tetratricopeptide repeat protein [Acetivibrio clariflavus]|uniref:Tetratricopeptide repeat protein n=1 Tax=Acetivibrio clariflavus (strain DSM 19732 / NBRC 101661 / EBR45) TaxID=720554 RepID=G8LW33_ACECE|nr:tetratricopeptide repeat protein [Acetivibrio clariflavus]AEV68637.1 tetratricopeptide repeat protein [Acetivibrio clariflavus DSM 19732]